MESFPPEKSKAGFSNCAATSRSIYIDSDSNSFISDSISFIFSSFELDLDFFKKLNTPKIFFISTEIICPEEQKQNSDFLPCAKAHEEFFKNGDASRKQILNLDGKLLLSTTENQLNISNLKAGVYLVRSTNEQGAPTTAKLIKN
jgi:hypothetical protein